MLKNNCIVVASDSFKGTLSSIQICDIAKKAASEVLPGCKIITVPVADGGEGTVDCFVSAAGATPVTVEVTGPTWNKVLATYAILETQEVVRSASEGQIPGSIIKYKTAVIEMASAAGLPLAGNPCDVANTTTYGVGELVAHAIDSGCTRILIGLGGSATNDCGCGMAAALGAVFRGYDGKDFIPTGGTLKDIYLADVVPCRKRMLGVQVTIMCDVDNPLYGMNGAAYVYGPQKGADEQTVRLMDMGMSNLAGLMSGFFGRDISKLPGTGAAGGMGAGCVWFLGAGMKKGVDAVLDTVGFDKYIGMADYIITGEGRLDMQSFYGKLASGVLERAKKTMTPVVAVVGSIDKTLPKELTDKFRGIYVASRETLTMEQIAAQAAQTYENALKRAFTDIKNGGLGTLRRIR